jgi:DNA polymerase II small subunit
MGGALGAVALGSAGAGVFWAVGRCRVRYTVIKVLGHPLNRIRILIKTSLNSIFGIRFGVMREKVLKVLLDHGTLVEPEAANFILAQKDPMGFVKNFLEGRASLPLFLTLDDVRGASVMSFDEDLPPKSEIQEKLHSQQQFQVPIEAPPQPMVPPRKDMPPPQRTPPVQTMPSAIVAPKKNQPEPAASPIAPDSGAGEFHIISDVSGASTCDGSIENFTGYFRDRFRIIRRIIKSHVEMGLPSKITNLQSAEMESKVIGMVMDVNKTKNGHIGITIEDDTGELFVLIHKDSELIGETILKDEVLGFVGKLSSGNRGQGGPDRKSAMFIPTAIFWPRVPLARAQRRSAEDIEVVFISDIHVGSSHFLPDAWSGFMEWINSPEASKVKYIVVAGDMVDGIGIYQSQEDELLILDINKQFEELARLMAPIPKHITVLMQPGNHDPVRPAEPQPAIAEKFRKYFGENYIFIGNPCYFSIAGVEILSYHGRSIDDLVGSIPGIKYQDPIPPMQEMLKRRLLAISYGGKTPLAPEARDYMAINPVPDILVTGHVHRTAICRENGITMINASAWQSQTPFQKMHNFHPDPGKIIVTNLKTGRCKIKDFMPPMNEK